MENISKYKEMVQELVRLKVLCSRYIERHTNKIFLTYRDLDNLIITSGRTPTYQVAVQTLKNNIYKYCTKVRASEDVNNYFKNGIDKLEHNILNSEIKNLRFGVEPDDSFTDLEDKLDAEYVKSLLRYTGLIPIKNASEKFGIQVSTIKQACQQERLLNTRKNGRIWLVDLQEVSEYWHIKKENQKSPQ